MLSKDTDRTKDVHKQVEAAQQLFVEHEVFIRSVIRYALSDHDAVDDFFNDLFLFLVAKPVPDDVRNLKGYLYKIIIDKAKDYRRRNIRYQQKLKGYARDQADINKANTMDEAVNDERIQRILKVLEGHLSKKEAQAVRLRYREQHNLGQVAELMNIKPQSAKKYISLGLKKIRTILGVRERADYDEGE
ncbi:MAG: sigma-70 family RNA polymerase sigma factor [Sedimentisphaerales bacterium]|nr:sigma-70 family RNA polymerase sigma factor [Sedimentisphaerales bacterium]